MEKNNNFDNKFRNFNKEVNNVNEAVANNAETAEIKNAVEEAAKTGMGTKKKVLIGAGILTAAGVLYYFGRKACKKWFGKKEEQPATTEVKNGEFEDVK